MAPGRVRASGSSREDLPLRILTSVLCLAQMNDVTLVAGYPRLVDILLAALNQHTEG